MYDPLRPASPPPADHVKARLDAHALAIVHDRAKDAHRDAALESVVLFIGWFLSDDRRAASVPQTIRDAFTAATFSFTSDRQAGGGARG